MLNHSSLKPFLKSRTFKLLAVMLLLLAALTFVYLLRIVFVPLVIGGIMAYIFEPLVKTGIRMGVSRAASMVVVYLVFLSLTAFVFFATGLGLSRQFQEISNSIESDVALIDEAGQPVTRDGKVLLLVDHNGNGTFDIGYRATLENYLARCVRTWNEMMPLHIDVQEVKAVINEHLNPPNSQSTDGKGKSMFRFLFGTLKDSVGGILVFATIIVMIPLYAFLLQQLVPKMATRLPPLIPVDIRGRTLRILSQINLELSKFFRGKLIVCILKGCLTWGGLYLLDVKYALFIGFVAGLLSVIPYLGAIVGYLMALIFNLLETGTLGSPIAILICFVLLEGVEFGLHLLVFGKEVGIHPLSFILALFIGGELFGVFGVIMAVPLISVVTILWKEFAVPVLDELAHPVEPEQPPSSDL